MSPTVKTALKWVGVAVAGAACAGLIVGLCATGFGAPIAAGLLLAGAIATGTLGIGFGLSALSDLDRPPPPYSPRPPSPPQYSVHDPESMELAMEKAMAKQAQTSPINYNSYAGDRGASGEYSSDVFLRKKKFLEESGLSEDGSDLGMGGR